uniref:AN1-type domain-containing protein n=1 Tax=Mesocestoides corti TaxID=53468 RepID=A0A5K3EF61_MESCO
MEFPDLGAQCAVKSCRMLDFLPVRCSGCQLVFCKDHYCFDCHSCPVGNSRDRQVPVCPLCGAPVPTGPNESADVKVGQHIDTSCKSQPALALKGKIFKNVCSLPKCKKKELVPFRCERCHLNYCISHRNEMDHNCKGPQDGFSGGRQMNIAGTAAIRRAVAKSNTNNAAAIAKAQQEEEDRQLAMALAASMEAEEQENRQRMATQLATAAERRQRTPAYSASECNVS